MSLQKGGAGRGQAEVRPGRGRQRSGRSVHSRASKLQEGVAGGSSAHSRAYLRKLVVQISVFVRRQRFWNL
eukprot:10003065-Heterocapsa_arctica.AAC.1